MCECYEYIRQIEELQEKIERYKTNDIKKTDGYEKLLKDAKIREGIKDKEIEGLTNGIRDVLELLPTFDINRDREIFKLRQTLDYLIGK